MKCERKALEQVRSEGRRASEVEIASNTGPCFGAGASRDRTATNLHFGQDLRPVQTAMYFIGSAGSIMRPN